MSETRDELSATMTIRPPHESSFERLWETMAVEETVRMRQDGTLVPDTIATPERALDHLRELPRMMTSRDIDTGELRVTRTIGEGGMGVVHLAHQTTIGREVAVKTVREDRRSPQASEELLREAWITGRLEHPNVVPVHALGVDEHASPLFVMKRVEGVSWEQALRHPELLPEMYRGEDELEVHLEIFEQVCQATHFAHSRGILHRDIKPENVMLGHFGEVYLVDWGIAVSMQDDPDGQLPGLDSVTGPAGTPGYMAPEMAAGEAEAMGPWTDVYLLGATLHQVVTGELRHRGEDLYSLMFHAYRSEPHDYPAEVPEELGAICNEATRRDPEGRHASAESLRQAVATFRRQRDAIRMVEALAPNLRALEQLAQRAEIGEEDAIRVHRLFGECRFGFTQALEVHPQGEVAREGLREARLHMIDIELRLENLAAAEALLEALEHPAPQRREALEALRARLAAERARLGELQRLEYNVDLEVDRRQRGFLTLALGAMWTGAALGTGWLYRHDMLSMDCRGLVLFNLGLNAVALSFMGVARRHMQVNTINARLLRFILVIMLAGLSVRVLAVMLDLSVPECIIVEIATYAMCTMVMAIFVDVALLVAGVVYLAAAFGAAYSIDWVWECFALGNTLALSFIGWRWITTHPEEADQAQGS